MTPWTVAHQAPLSREFSRQEYWSGLPFLSPGDLPNPGIEPQSPALLVDSLLSEAAREALIDSIKERDLRAYFVLSSPFNIKKIRVQRRPVTCQSGPASKWPSR